MTLDPDRDPYNSAVAATLTRRVDDAQTGIVRISRLSGIPRGSLRRYLDGDRDIPVAKLRKIAAALQVDVLDILTEAEGRIEQGDQWNVDMVS